MKHAHLTSLAAFLLLAITSTLAAQDVKITFQVKVPEGTPADAKVFISGDSDKMGPWKADGLELEKADDGTYVVSVELPKDKVLEYKMTRGSWETVEKNADGSEMANRSLTPTRDAKVEITVAAWADKGKSAAEKKSTATGDIREHKKFHSKNLNNDRDIFVWLPRGYDRQPDLSYPVLYMQDGQNLFDDATSFAGEWQADETAQHLIEDGTIAPIIIVAISNTPDRKDEYTLYRDEQIDSGGKGKQYMAFVAEELKPFIDANYRTLKDRQHTAVGGSSLGATISIEICRAYPDQFGKCIAMSPALFWAKYELIKQLDKDSSWMKDCKFWIDCGTAEGDNQTSQNAYVGGLLRLESKLLLAGLKKGAGYEEEIAEGAKHNEQAWAKRFGRALIFLFPPEAVTYNQPHG